MSTTLHDSQSLAAPLAPKTPQITTLQVGRAAAAIAVVVHHAALATEDFVQELPQFLVPVLKRGYLGVDFFFVLSGFIIYYSTTDEAGQIKLGIGSFAEKRLSRIFIPYLPIGISLALAYSLLPALSAGDRQWSWVTTITLLPLPDPCALSVAWTLQHELVFYAVFGVALVLKRPTIIMALWMLAILAALTGGWGTAGSAKFFLHPINLEFGFGMVAAVLYASRPTLGSSWLFLGAAATSLATFLALGAQRRLSVILGLSMAFLIVPLCRWETAGKVKFGRTSLLLGAASYSIYLIHNPLISLVVRLPLETWYSAMVVGTFSSLVAGVLYHLAYEKRAIARFKSAVKRREAKHAESGEKRVR